jgi:hypothetical protein
MTDLPPQALGAVPDRVVTELSVVHWQRWQTEVVSLLRGYLHGELAAIDFEDVDWPSWRPFFVQGRSPRAAVDRALERDI